MSEANLFTPVRIGDIALHNRIAMAPMTRNRSPGGVPTELNALYYAQRASAGLIITEGTTPDAGGRGYIDIPGLYDAAQVAGWRRVTDAVHATGGRIVVQLMHTGRISHPDFLDGGTPVAPSAVAAAGNIFTRQGPKPHPVPRALEAHEIPAVIASYGRAASLAIEAGFDGVEIHGANGYLPSQFLSTNVNLRTDDWGGSVENRARFLLGAVAAAAEAIGAGRVGLRVSPGSSFNDIADSDPEATLTHIATALRGRGLAYFHLVGGAYGYDAAGIARRRFDGPLMLNGGYDRARADADIAAGRADLVSFGSAFLANPDLPERLRTGAALNAPDTATFYGGDAKGYTDYPALAAAA
ncbi:alkene reductase [Roseomonas fluvialis]|uniref:Alkene reductase n=1 Tax=Roseomonas fluvialis TaxID=1750527 RepID=A0ABN6P866_9PROT|nr:alkene reductase [Roseomonas fluvialis]BDG75092.1 alkene reductase [Roseomonas fluvialis]